MIYQILLNMDGKGRFLNLPFFIFFLQIIFKINKIHQSNL